MNSRSHPACAIVTVIIILASTHAAAAADPPPAPPAAESRIVESVVVTATGHEADSFDVPYVVEVVDRQEIRSRKASRSMAEALRDIPSVLVQKTAYGQGSPFIRGFTGFHTLFLVDGIRLNHSALRSGPNQYWATVDPLAIDRVEIVKGPSSVLYGSDAVGGTVNALTASPARHGSSFQTRPSVYYRFGSAGTSHTGNADVSLGLGPSVGLLVNASRKDHSDLVAGSGMGVQPYTGYDESFGHVKLEIAPQPGSKLVVAYQGARQDDVPRTHTTLFAETFHGTTAGTERRRELDQQRDLAYVQYHVEQPRGFIDRAKLSLSYHRHDESQDRLRQKGRGGDLQGFELQTLGLWGTFESSTRIGHLTYGFEHYRDDVDSFRIRFDDAGNVAGIGIQGPVADDAAYDLFGLYLQDELPLGSRLGLTAGARYTYASADADRVDVGGVEQAIAGRWDAVVGSARLAYRWNDHWNLFGGISQGFRAPNLSDLSKLDDTSAIEVPSPSLEPERFVSLEVGAKTRSERYGGQAAYWYTLIDDLIVQSPTGNSVDGVAEVRKDNVGDGIVHGIEIEGFYAPSKRWMFFGNFCWMHGEVDQLDEAADFTIVEAPLSRLMPATAVLGGRYRTERRAWIEGFVTLADEQDRLALRDRTDTSRIPPGGTPGYATFAVRGGVTLNGAYEITGAVENLTNRNYRIHGSGLNEPGRTLLVTLDAKF